MKAGASDPSCREVAEFLAAYLDGELGAEQCARFEAHLAECPDCRTYLRQYVTTIRLAKVAAARDDGGGAVPEALVDAILAATGKAPHCRGS